MTDDDRFWDSERVKHADDLVCDPRDRNRVISVRRPGGAISVNGDTAVLLCEMRDDGIIVVLRGSQTMNENYGVAVCWGTVRMRIGVVEAVAVGLYERHFRLYLKEGLGLEECSKS
jgi:hypothetical protein